MKTRKLKNKSKNINRTNIKDYKNRTTTNAENKKKKTKKKRRKTRS